MTPMLSIVRAHLGLVLFAIVVMTAFNFLAHGTQDLYPTYLQVQRHLTVNEVTAIAIVYNIGAMVGGIGCGTLSQHIGRRVTIVIMALLALPTIPLWAFSVDPVWIGIGAFLMQVFVQGAWGVIPAHLNELSPPEAAVPSRAWFTNWATCLHPRMQQSRAPGLKVWDTIIAGHLRALS